MSFHNPSMPPIKLAVFQYCPPGSNQPQMIVKVIPEDIPGTLNAVSSALDIEEPPDLCACVTLEFSAHHLLDEVQLNTIGQNGRLAIETPVSALIEKLIGKSKISLQHTGVVSVNLQILEMCDSLGVPPDICIEVSHVKDLQADIEWWGPYLPGSVLGHISLEIYRDLFLEKTEKRFQLVETEDKPCLFEFLVAHEAIALVTAILRR